MKQIPNLQDTVSLRMIEIYLLHVRDVDRGCRGTDSFVPSMTPCRIYRRTPPCSLLCGSAPHDARTATVALGYNLSPTQHAACVLPFAAQDIIRKHSDVVTATRAVSATVAEFAALFWYTWCRDYRYKVPLEHAGRTD